MSKRALKKILLVAIISLIFVFILFVIKIFAKDVSIEDANYLFVGIDDAGDNTDVIAVASIKNNKLMLLQIPRDTYLNIGCYQNKINQCFSYFKSQNKSEKEAMSELTSLISRQLGIRLDGFIGVKTKSFLNIIDMLGGINVSLDREINIKINGVEHIYKRGENKLDGNEALALVRHRASYKGGDLERLKVQRSVYRGIIEAVFKECTNRQIISMVGKISKDMIVGVPLKDAFMLLSTRGSVDYTLTTFEMLKGTALTDERGVWYYALNRRQNEDLLNMLYGISPAGFDKDHLFLNNKNNKFIKIYNS